MRPRRLGRLRRPLGVTPNDLGAHLRLRSPNTRRFRHQDPVADADGQGARPLPPSPVTTQTIGTSIKDIRRIDSAMTTPCPRSSASIPGYAPTTSMRGDDRAAELLGLLHQADRLR